MIAATLWAISNIATAIVVVTFLWQLFCNLVDGEPPLDTIFWSAMSALFIIPVTILTWVCLVRGACTDK